MWVTYKITNTSAPWVEHLSPSSLKVTRPSKLIEHDSHSNHAPINEYLWCPTPSMPEVDVGSRLVAMVAFMNCLWPPIENLSTQWIIKKKRLINQPTIAFVGEQNYKWPHIDDGILDN